MSKSPFQIKISIIFISFVVLELSCILHENGGHFFFTLDDPYIHLAVGRSILSGGFGINNSEYSSPSSSIIWPYLMAITEALHLGPCGPLLLCLASACATVWTMARVLVREDIVNPETGVAGQVAASFFCILIASAVALPMTGMEHSLHVFLTVLTFSGLLEASKGRPVKWPTIASIVCLPLIRFEGAVFAGTAICVLILLGRFRAAAKATGTLVVALTAYAFSMVHRGLSVVPSSVLMKSDIAASAYGSGGLLGRVRDNMRHILAQPEGLVLLGLVVTLGVLLLVVRPARQRMWVFLAVLLAGIAHLIGGTYGWFFRYEVYAVALVALACFVLLASDGKALVSRISSARAAVAAILAIACLPYMVAIVETPHAAMITYDQQEQLGRFAQQFYRKPVAVNDLGLVSYGNPNFVLDLWGLGSEEVRKAKLANRYGPAAMEAAARAHNIGAAMIYQAWFPQGVPKEWQRVGVLHAPVGISGTGDVAFYGTSPEAAAEVRRSLQAFASTLPKADTFTRD